MNTFEFIASIIHSVIWPIVVFVLLLIFKEHVVQFIYSIRRVSFRQLRVDVGERLTEIESITEGQTLSVTAREHADGQMESIIQLTKQVEEIATCSPRAAILYTWSVVEKSIYDMIENQDGFDIGEKRIYWIWLKKKKILDRHMMRLLYKMHQLHEDVVTNQGGHEISHSDARRFFALAQRIIKAIWARS